ncbi:unnamed protein product [Rodentolepis nana]|uniref:MBOAT_2 domain-containing protein n=1 Tax=Rodentolepis nana TaxID=102285 RepID=A0A0R3T2F8_RODNA|nr:unnamed protein product [Rodentolepis nana]
MMVFLPPNVVQYAVLLFTMSFLSWAHIQRLFADGDPRQQSVDITAPLMIQTQKLSSIAFNFYDGTVLSSGKELRIESHKTHAIKSRPKLLPFFSYLMCFQNSMVGPFVFFTDYLNFIEGREEDQVSDPTERDYVMNHKDEIRNPKGVLKTHFITFVFHFVLALYASGRYEPTYLISDEFQRLGIFRKYFWLTLYGFYLRQKFYCAWTLSALAMLVSGFGFSGFSSSSTGALEPEYRNAINFRFWGCEVNSWNLGTVRWLRECVYVRAPKRHAVVSVFLVSAFWHGFYPVYYLCFLSAALVTMTGRLCRARLRPCFLKSYWHHRLYDVLTSLSALFCLNYLGCAFALLDASMTLKFWGTASYFTFYWPISPLGVMPQQLACSPDYC